MIPPPAEYWKRPPDGIVEEQRLAAAETFSLLSLWYIGNILEFIALKLGQEGKRGAHKPGGHALPPRARLPSLSLPHGSSGLLPKLRGSLLVQKKLIQSFFFVWTPFDNDFLKRQNRQKTATGTGH